MENANIIFCCFIKPKCILMYTYKCSEKRKKRKDYNSDLNSASCNDNILCVFSNPSGAIINAANRNLSKNMISMTTIINTTSCHIKFSETVYITLNLYFIS